MELDFKERKKQYQITEYCHQFISRHVGSGDICIDATAGNGYDTEFLCGLVGPEGKVYAFDIQADALAHTAKRLETAGMKERVDLLHAGHEKMQQFVNEEVAAVVFNFGYLPGGDHAIATTSTTSIQAISQGLELLRIGGIMSLCIYSGGDTGFEEKEQILSYLKELDPKQWLVIASEYYNRKNNPPMPVVVIRIK